MESFLHGCSRGLPIHKPRFVNVLLDSGDNWPDERLVPAHHLNILNSAIGPDCYGEVDGTGLAGQFWQQKRVGTGDFVRKQDKNPFVSDRPGAKLGAKRNIGRIFGISRDFVSRSFQDKSEAHLTLNRDRYALNKIRSEAEILQGFNARGDQEWITFYGKTSHHSPSFVDLHLQDHLSFDSRLEGLLWIEWLRRMFQNSAENTCRDSNASRPRSLRPGGSTRILLRERGDDKSKKNKGTKKPVTHRFPP